MGGRKKTIEDEEILRIIIDHPDPFIHTQELADEIDFSQRGAYSRLTDLEDHGYLNVKKAGKTNIWWVTDAGIEFVESAESE